MGSPKKLPDPLVPADCELQAYDWFPLYHKRLIRSSFWLRSSPEVAKASVELWCAAYQEVPCGSLPDDDIALTRAAGVSRDIWTVLRTDVMSPWRLCSDGRWYHPVLCEIALEAWKMREAKREREREKKRRQRATSPVSPGDKKADAPREIGIKNSASLGVSPGNTPSVPDITETDTVKGTEQKKRTISDSGEGGESYGAAKARAGRGTRLPFGFHPGEKGLAFAESLGLLRDDIWAITDAFADYWCAQPGQKGVKTNWPATWRNWIRKEAERRIERGGRNGGSKHGNGSGAPAGPIPATARTGRMLEGAVAALERGRRGQDSGSPHRDER